MTISLNDLISHSYIISINDNILSRFNYIFHLAGFTELPKPIYGFKFSQDQFKKDKFLKNNFSDSVKNKYGALGCGVSHASLIKHAQLNNFDFICIFEDDAYPCIDVLKQLQYYLTDIPDDCDILKIGWSRVYSNESEFHDKFNDKPRSWGTFAYIVFKKYFNRYFEQFEKSYVSDYIVMNNDQLKIYHTKQKIFSYYNDSTDNVLNSHGNLKTNDSNFSMDLVKQYKSSLFNSITTDKILVNTLKELSSFIYRANGGNTGDIVIAFSELQLFDKYHFNYTMINTKNKQSLIDKPFNLVYGGGGGWIDLYQSNCQKQLQTYFNNKNLQKCIIMPSTFYKCDDIVKSFDERFIVFCRDPQSLQYCKSINSKSTFILHNDSVFSADFSQFDLSNLSDIKGEEYDSIRKNIHDYRIDNTTQYANFIRTDKEKTISINTIKYPNFDLSLIKQLNGEQMNKLQIINYTKLFLYLIDKYSIIYTNRLHVSICAYKLKKHIICYDNSYGKVFNTLKYSIPNYQNIEFKK